LIILLPNQITGEKTMTLPAWWNIATPRKEICDGTFNESSFAVDIAEVVKGTAPQEYLDARLFFEKTYLTSGLQRLICNVLTCIANSTGDKVIQLQTPFGGGKTHSLLAIYHLVKSFSEINHLSQIQSLANNLSIPSTKVAVFVGTEADVINGKTPWGKIAEQLGCYHLIKDHDQKRIAPGKEILREIIKQSGSVLILIDELLAYITKANQLEKQEKIAQGQTLVFLQEITEVIAASDNSVLILTLPKSDLEQFDEAATRALSQLEKIAGRVETIYVPVDGIEIYEVVRKRLFDNIGDIDQHKQTAETYFRLYQQLGNDVPSEVKEISYRTKIEQAYPFHPELIDTLYERWGSFPTFQRTRGVLRLLAEVIKDLYKQGADPLIQSSQINLSNPALKRELIKHIGNEFDSIITSDIMGKSQQIDRDMGSEYEKYNIASKLATGVFFYSFSGSDRRGVSLSWLRIALLNSSIPSTIIGDAIAKLADNLWYFHEEKPLYSFKNEPNLNRVIVDREQLIDDEQITDKLRELIKEQPKSKFFETHIWKESQDIPDHTKFKLVILHPNYKKGDEETEKFTQELFSNTSFRIYKNTVFLVIVDAANYVTLEKHLKRYLALSAITEDQDLKKTLSLSSKTDLQDKLSQAKKDTVNGLIVAYRHLAWCGQNTIDYNDFSTATKVEGNSWLERIENHIKNQRHIISKIAPNVLLKGLSANETEKSLQDIYNNSLRTPGQKPLLENELVILEAVKIGVKEGKFGVRFNEKLYYEDNLHEVTLAAILVRPELAQAEKTQLQTQSDNNSNNNSDSHSNKTPENISQTSSGNSTVENPLVNPGKVETPSGTYNVNPSSEAKTQTKVKKVKFKADLPWSKLSNLVRGVITPLQAGASNIKITIEIEAESSQGYDRHTLDNTVKETLKQLDSKILNWEEDEK
jgi:predicted AAA+ superfamily ATPase